MQSVKVNLEQNSYNIFIGDGLIENLGPRIAGILDKKNGACALITNDTIAPLYAKTVMDSLTGAGFSPALISVRDGEEYKSLDTVRNIYTQMLAAGLDRKSFIVALGGGVIGDMAGFAAATFMRGIKFFQIPTSLMAQVDSSIGGKTGVNLDEGKNLVGAFCQPQAVITDVNTLMSLPEREYVSGFAEIIKHAVILDAQYFEYLENNVQALLGRDKKTLIETICRSSKIKAGVVANDERESGLRAILNYGHTIGHAIESLSGYGTLLHGEAVSLGMCAAAELSIKLGFTNQETANRQRSLLQNFGLPVMLSGAKLDTDKAVYFISHDKKIKDGKLSFIALDVIGKCSIRTIGDPSVLATAFKHIQ